MKEVIQKQALSTSEAAQFCGVSESFLRQSRMTCPGARKLNGPEFTKIGSKKVVYLREHLLRWLDKCHAST